MIDALSASLVSGVAQSASNSLARYSPSNTNFGPDYLVNLLSGTRNAGGAAYDANGQYTAPPDSPAGQARTAAINQARAALIIHDLPKARDAAQKVLANDPNDSLALYYVGRSYLEEGDYGNAQKYLARAAQQTDDARIPADLRAAQILSKGSAAALTQVNRLISQPGTQDEGLRLATYLLKTDPANLDAHLVLVNFYESQNKLNIAGAELLDAIDQTPKDQSATLIKRLQQFVADHPYDSGSHDLIAQAYAKFGQNDSAEREFKEALRLAGDNTALQTDIKKSYADVLSKAGHAAQTAGNDFAARAAYRRALELNRDDTRRADLAGFEYLSGEKALRVGNLRNALTAYEQARVNLPIGDNAKLKADLISAYGRLAQKFADAGDLKRVVAAKNGAFQLDPADDTKRRGLADANVNYGQSLAAAGDYYGAIKSFRAATKLYSDDANYAALLADALSHI